MIRRWLCIVLCVLGVSACADDRYRPAAPMIGQDPDRIFINQRDIELYVDKILNQDNRGYYRKPDQRIHKIAQPLTIALSWPQCTATFGPTVRRFALGSGVNLVPQTEYDLDHLPALLILGTSGLDDLKNHPTDYRVMTETPPWTEAELTLDFDRAGDKGFALAAWQPFPQGQTTSAILLQRSSAEEQTRCPIYLEMFIFNLLTNSRVTFKHYDLDDLDYLFVNALYDPSIAEGMPEDDAKPKLIQLMLSRLPPRK